MAGVGKLVTLEVDSNKGAGIRLLLADHSGTRRPEPIHGHQSR